MPDQTRKKIKQMTKTILVVDDSTTTNLLCESIFQEKEYQVIIVDKGKEAFNRIKKDQPDIVLLDLMLPGTDGFTILKQLKQNDHTKQIPVIVVSARASREDREKALEYGALDYVMKPIGANNLVEKVESILDPAE